MIVVLVLASCVAAPARAGSLRGVRLRRRGRRRPERVRRGRRPEMSAYSICPPAQRVGTGIVTKATSSGGVARTWPARTRSSRRRRARRSRASPSTWARSGWPSYWTAGIVAYDGDFNAGDYPTAAIRGTPDCGVGTPSSRPGHREPLQPPPVPLRDPLRQPGGLRHLGERLPPGTARCSRPRTSSCASTTAPRRRRAALRRAVADGWHRGRGGWTSYTDNVGIMVTRLYVDGGSHADTDYRDGSLAGLGALRLHPPAPVRRHRAGRARPRHRDALRRSAQHRVEAVDAAGNVGARRSRRSRSTTRRRPSRRDCARRRRGLARAQTTSRSRWRTRPGRWRRSRAPTTASAAPAGGAASTGGRGGEGIIGSTTSRCPAPGEYTLRVWLEDAAGNQDPAARQRPGAPALRRRGSDGCVRGRPTPMIRSSCARASRTRAPGVAAASIEIRRAAPAQWQELGRASATAGASTARSTTSPFPTASTSCARSVRDAAGNERTGDAARGRLADGAHAAAARREPDRALDRSRCRKRPRGRRSACCRPAGRVRGNGATVRGELARGRRSVPDARRSRCSRAPRTGGRSRARRSLRTDASGRFAFRAGRARRARCASATRHAPRASRPQTDVRVLVPPARRSPSTGAPCSTATRSPSAGGCAAGPVPDGGKLIDLQAYYRGRWRTFATPRTRRRGRWSYRYRFEATRGRGQYRFRARIRREAAYPYELGSLAGRAGDRAGLAASAPAAAPDYGSARPHSLMMSRRDRPSSGCASWPG